MKKIVVVVVFACVWVGLILAQSLRSPLNDPSDVAAIKHVEQEMGDAMVAADVGRLSRVYGDDFASVASSGKLFTKETLLTDFKSFHDKLEWFEIGNMDVQVLGNVAVAHGSVSEKRNRDGKDTSGDFVWMDLLEKRAGRWVVVRSAGARVK